MSQPKLRDLKIKRKHLKAEKERQMGEERREQSGDGLPTQPKAGRKSEVKA